jgi:hypothetical protein
MKKVTYSLFIAALLAILVTSTALAGYTISPRLLAGQTGFAGVVKITGDADFLTIEFQLRSGAGWCLEESAVHVGLSLDDFPQNHGGVIPGQFDYKADHNCASGFTYQIPTDNAWYGNQIYIATHAVVTGPDGQQETAWAVNCGNLEGGQFPGKNWSAYIIFPANAWY